MTANVMQQDRDRCLKAGMNDHLAKPLDPDELWTVLSRWIPSRQSTARTMVPLIEDAVDHESDSALPDIQGINMREALYRVGSDAGLLRSLLHNFAAQHKTAGTQIRSALERGDWQHAERLAHTLKGLAGTLGASDIQPLAAKLETVLIQRAERQIVDNALEPFADKLASLIAELEQQLPAGVPGATSEPEPGTEGPSTATDICRLLSQLLSEDDISATQFLSTHAPTLRQALDAHFELLATAIQSFDFATAQKQLAEACEAKGIVLD